MNAFNQEGQVIGTQINVGKRSHVKVETIHDETIYTIYEVKELVSELFEDCDEAIRDGKINTALIKLNEIKKTLFNSSLWL